MKRLLTFAGKILLAVVAAPIAALSGLTSGLFRLKEKRTGDEIAFYLRAFLEGDGDEWDWDEFVSLSIADRELDGIRRRADAVELPLTEVGKVTLRKLLAEVEHIGST